MQGVTLCIQLEENDIVQKGWLKMQGLLATLVLVFAVTVTMAVGLMDVIPVSTTANLLLVGGCLILVSLIGRRLLYRGQ